MTESVSYHFLINNVSGLKAVLFIRVVAPKKAKLEEAEASLREKQAKLAAAIAKVAELQKLLDQLKADYDEKLAQKEELAEKVRYL